MISSPCSDTILWTTKNPLMRSALIPSPGQETVISQRCEDLLQRRMRWICIGPKNHLCIPRIGKNTTSSAWEGWMIQNNNPSCQQPHSLRLAPAGSSRNMQESSNNGCSPEIDFAENMSGKPGIQRKKTLVPVCVHLNQSIECCSKLKPETMNLFAGHVQHVCHGFLVTRMKEKWNILL